MSRLPLILGITGGIGSGKSSAAAEFERLGAARLDADAAGHAVLERPEVKQAAFDRFGPDIFLSAAGGEAIFPPDSAPCAPQKMAGSGEFWLDYSIARDRLAGRLFTPTDAGAADLSFWNGLTHPRIAQEIERQIQKLAEEGKIFAVLDAALLFEAKWERFCSAILFVDAPKALRLARIRSRGWPEGELERREWRQLPTPEKRDKCDFRINNGGDRADLVRQTVKIFDILSKKSRLLNKK